jgi:glycosyltransferase 2 family protein
MLERLLFVGGVALFVYLIAAFGPLEILHQLQALGWAVLLLVPLVLAIYTVETVAWRMLFHRPPAVPLPRLIALYVAGESLNEILPGLYLGGEPYRVLMLRRWGVPVMEGLASVIVSRTAMTVALAAFIVFGIAAAVATQAGGALDPIVALGIAAALFTGGGIFFAYLTQRHGVGRVLDRLVGWTGLGGGWLARHREALAHLDHALETAYRERPHRFWLACLLFLASWSIEALEVAIFVWALGLPLGPLEIYSIGALAMGIKAAGSFVPASAGVQEGGIVLIGMAFGLPPSTALAFGVLRRGRQLVTVAAGLVPIAVWSLSNKNGQADSRARR